MMRVWWLGVLLLFVVGLGWPNLAWRMRRPFLWINRWQWALENPLRGWMRDPRSEGPRRLLLWGSPLVLLLGLACYVISTPLRLINAFYFDILLFWSVSLRDGIADLVRPHYDESGLRYVLRWLYLFPWRLGRFMAKYLLTLLQGLAMSALDLFWPTLTLFHGTGRREARTIARTGEWFAGTGTYVGTGIYFGLDEAVGQHYARNKAFPLVILARVTLFPCRPVATLPAELRRQIGRGGGAINRGMHPAWVSLEHWRHDRQWYEFCLLQPSQYDPTRPWRVRPICVLGRSEPERLPGGTAHWPSSRQGWIVLGLTLLALVVPLVLAAALPALAIDPGRPVDCPGTLPSRLQAGRQACVADIGADALRVRSSPAIEANNSLAVIYRGTPVAVLDGPACAGGYLWWRVRLEDGTTGWAAEGGNSSYYLEPCP